MNTGGKPSEVNQNTPSSSIQPQMDQPGDSFSERSTFRSFFLLSQLLPHKTPCQKNSPSCEKAQNIAIPEVVIAPESHEAVEKSEKVFEESQKNEVKQSEEPRKKGPVTLKNFAHQLKELWEKDPTLPPEDFFKLATKLFGLVQDEDKQYVNLNKAWCKRFLKKIKSQKDEENMNSEQNGQEKQKKSQSVSETFYEMISESESANMEHTIANTSEAWKSHSKKLLAQAKKPGKRPKIIKYENNGGKVWVVNESVAKTLKNRTFEINYLEHQIKRNKIKARKIQELTEKKERVMKE